MKKLLPLLIAALMVIPTAMTAQTDKTRQWKGAPSKLSTTTEKGDINGDGIVSITDVTTLVDVILTGLPQNTDASIYDINGDGDVTVSDVTVLVDNILENNQNLLQLSTTKLNLTTENDGHFINQANILILSSIGGGQRSYSIRHYHNFITTDIDFCEWDHKFYYYVTVTAKSEGEDNIIVTDKKTGQTSTINVTVGHFNICPNDNHPHMIDLGLPSGTKWACCNVGADKPEGYGDYYSWGETWVKSYYTYGNYKYYNRTYLVSEYIGDDIAGTNYDVAHVKWGDSWVMPSVDQIKELGDNCTCTYSTMNGVNGILLNNPNGTIFLPAGGDGNNHNVLTDGHYWSSTQHPSYIDYAYMIYFWKVINNFNSHYNRTNGCSVRPVWVP